MGDINRREFMKRTAGAIAAGAAVPGLAGGETPRLTATTMRTLGKTGLECSLLGMGTGMHGWKGQSDLTRKGHDACIEVLAHAYAQGIRYFDMADMYGSHPYMKELMAAGRIAREKVTLLTKTVSRKPEEVRADIERFRKELDTDRLDIVMMHCVTDPEWPEKMQACMEVIEDAKAKGLVRAHGLSCHRLEALQRAAETDWVDVVLARINPFGVKMDAPPDEVVPLLRKAHEAGKGVLGMKIAGEGQCRDKIGESLKFVIGLGCVDAMPIGFLATGEIDSAMAHVEAIGAA